MNQPMQQQVKRLERRLKLYAEKEVPRATARVLNRGTKAVASKVTKTVAAEVKVKSSILKKQVFSGRATRGSLRSYVKSYLRPISAARLISASRLQKAAPRGTNRKGVRVAGLQFDHAFINKGGKSNQYKVLVRKGAARYPLRMVTIAIDRSVNAHQLPISERFMRDDFVRQYKRELEFRLSKYGR